MGISPVGLIGTTVPLEVEGNSSAPASATTRHPPSAAPTVWNQMWRLGPAQPGLSGVGGVCVAVTGSRPGPGPANLVTCPDLWRDNLTVLGRAWRRETTVTQMMVGATKQPGTVFSGNFSISFSIVLKRVEETLASSLERRTPLEPLEPSFICRT